MNFIDIFVQILNVASSQQKPNSFFQCLYEAYESISKMKMFPFMKKVMFDQSSSWLALHLNLSGNLVKCQIFDMLHKVSATNKYQLPVTDINICSRLQL